MSGKKLIGIVLVTFVVVFGAVLAALQVDRMTKTSGEQGRMLDLLNPAIQVQNTAAKAPFDFVSASKKIVPSVVSVDNIGERTSIFGDRVVAKNGSGSGVIVSKDGYIITNNHVVEDAAYLRVKLADNRQFNAKLIGRDPRSDLALLKIEATGLTSVAYGDSSKLEVGAWVVAVGSPLGYESTLSVGVISTKARTLPTEGALLVDAIQTDASINQGNSGGALCTYGGELIGINTAIASVDGGSIGLGFAIPINRVRKVVAELLKYGRMRYGSMGIRVDRRDGLLGNPDAREELQLRTNSTEKAPEQGLLIQVVDPAGPAAKAGLKQLDVILEVDGRKMTSNLDLEKVMLEKKPDDKAKVKAWVSGKTKEVELTLTEQN